VRTRYSSVEWQALAATHLARANALLAQRERNPVEDFLWTYYATRPVHLTTWHPGAHVTLEAGQEYYERRGYRATAAGVEVDPLFVSARRQMIEETRALLVATHTRPAQHGCFGMHEWAMVYGLSEEQIRHSQWPLRFGREENMRIVEELGVRCSHFDAFRFFTEDAKPINQIQPTRQLQIVMEQPGCIHANMDLLKWSLKLMPMIASDVLLDAFENARALRRLDMQASPYDLSELGVHPVRVESAEGRAEYRDRQRALAERSAPIRARLISSCDQLLQLVDLENSGHPAMLIWDESSLDSDKVTTQL
jgi:hypothetical protein